MRVFLTAVFLASILSPVARARSIEYPPTRRGSQVDVYHGTRVADPYRWLEADVRKSQEVAQWVAAQNRVTRAFLSSIPERQKIRAFLMKLWDYERYSAPFKEGGKYYFYKNDGLQDHSVLYVQDTLKDEPRPLLDPNTWSEDGSVSLSGTEFSEDGHYLAYGVRKSGSDWRTFRILDLGTGERLSEEIRWVKYSSPSWTRDGRGFFYGRFPAPAKGNQYQDQTFNQKIYYHRVGTPQSRDVLVYHRPDHPQWGFGSFVTEDGRYLILTIWSGGVDAVRVAYRDLTEPLGCAVDLIEKFEHNYGFVGNDGPVFFFETDRGAPRGRLIAIDTRRPNPKNWKEIIPQSELALRSVSLVGNLFVTRYLKDATTFIRMFSTDGAHVRDVKFPSIGSARGFHGRRTDTETFYSFSSFATPPSIYRYDMITGRSRLLRRAEVDIRPEDYVVKQVFYKSRDGTRIPMFITHRVGIECKGDHPTLLYGYGGFNIPLTPGFSQSRAAWLKMGGVYAVANLRGGGEYGKEWHKAGTRTSKQNVFDDFIAAAQWLIENKYTNPKKLAIQGGSNGGLLVGAVMTQRPGLFGACLPAVGVMDMLRYHRFTAGRFWVDDYGCSDDPKEFKALWAYSPYHNLKPGVAYPPTLVTTADTDDRVVPSHSFKFTAALQHAQASSAPVLIRIETKAGHGGGRPVSQVIDEVADTWAFVVHALKMELKWK
jgi:prolyl oligopeptidase